MGEEVDFNKNDNFGPIWIPKQGETVNISRANIALYKRVIGVYENNDLKIQGDKRSRSHNQRPKCTFSL